MEPTIVVGLLSLAGTLVGSLFGVVVSNKMATYRIEQLEKKVDRHNSVIERTLILERDMKTAYSKIDRIERRIDE